MIRPARAADDAALRALDRETWSPLTSPAPAPLAANRHVALIRGLAVAPAHRGRGLGGR
jgi:hypothetical protein